MADSGERTSSFSHDPLVCNCMLLDYCLLDVLKRERNTLCSIYGLRSVCKQLKQPVKVSLSIKTRLIAQPLIWKGIFILVQRKVIFTRKVVHLASF